MLRGKTILLMGLGATVLAGSTGISPAVAFTFSDVTSGLLTFESNGSVVGTGNFTYEPTAFEGTFVASGTPQFYIPDKTLTITANQNLRLIDAINISILGKTFNNNANRGTGSGGSFSSYVADYFWGVPGSVFPDPNVGPQEVVISYNGPIPSVQLSSNSSPLGNGWFFGSSRSDYLQLDRDGTWRDLNLTGTPSNQNPYTGGTWTATAEGVPEPFTVVGTLMAALAGCTMKRKLKQTP